MFTYEWIKEKGKIAAVCLSSDTKPINSSSNAFVICNGSTCLEMDTGNIFMFDAEHNVWIKFGNSGGGASVDTDGNLDVDGSTVDNVGIFNFGIPTSIDEDGIIHF